MRGEGGRLQGRVGLGEGGEEGGVGEGGVEGGCAGGVDV